MNQAITKRQRFVIWDLLCNAYNKQLVVTSSQIYLSIRSQPEAEGFRLNICPISC